MKIQKFKILAFTALLSFCNAEAVMNKHGISSSRSSRDNDDDDDNKPRLGLFKGLKKYMDGYQSNQGRPSSSSSSRNQNNSRVGGGFFGQNNDDNGGGSSSLQRAANNAISHHVTSGGMSLGSARSGRGSMGLCYRHVKYILSAGGCVDKGELDGGSAKYAGPELLAAGFQRINVSSPSAAPNGSVVVYGCGQHGHIEVKVGGDFYSDFRGGSAYGGCGNNFKVYKKRGC